MPKIGSKVKIFSALEVANICGVVNQTAINWIKSGYLKAFTTPGGQYRIYARDLAVFLETRGMNDSGEVLQVFLEKANLGTLLIAAEEAVNKQLTDELGSLLPAFSIIQAFDGFDLGHKMAGEKPGFLLLDQDLAGINHDRLIQLLKTDPVFGRPFIFAIGNFHNPENLIDKVFAKPPDIEEIYRSIKSLESQTDTIT